jgi:predicted amidohydrolase YtcJ
MTGGKLKKYLYIFLVGVVFYSCSYFTKDADMILKNGHIYTLDEKNSVVEAVAIKDGKIEATGTNEEILKKYQCSNIIDLEGKFVYPGFIDSHGHLLGYGVSLTVLDFNEAKSPEEIADMIAKKAKEVKPGEWIVGTGWDQNSWAKKEFPSHRLLDKAAPDNPVFLIRTDGHAIWVNVNAMIEAGITPDTKEPEGGKILKTKNGEPTGIFIDNAMRLIEKVRKDMTPDQKEKAVLAAMNKLTEMGITEIHDMGVDEQTINIYKKLIDENKLPIRIYAFIDGVGKTWDAYKTKSREVYGKDYLTIAGIKLYVDGALGSRGAALIEPYNDDKGNRGLTTLNESDIQRITEDALKNNFQVAVHAIGDRGNSIVLNAYEKALKSVSGNDHRLRIEHAQIINPDDIKRFAGLKVIPSMQPVHATSDMYWAESRLGSKRLKHSYLWNTLISSGCKVPSGSDFPVEKPDIIENYYAAVTRKDKNGIPNSWAEDKKFFTYDANDLDTSNYSNGWYASEKMNRLDALKSFTEWGAYAAFQEKIKGTIEVGKYADLVILSDNILETHEKDILNIKIIKTIVNGKIVFEKR